MTFQPTLATRSARYLSRVRGAGLAIGLCGTFATMAAGQTSFVASLGEWDVAGNWNDGAPVNGAGATIDNGGTVTLSNSTARFVSGLTVGDSGTGTLILSSGTLTDSGSTYLGNNGTVTVDGGLFSAGEVSLGTGSTLNLNGGVLVASQISRDGTTAALNLNGGTLRASANTALLYGFSGGVQLGSQGVIIDTQSYRVSLVNTVLQGTGGLTKQGTGTLTLGGTHTYAGGTTVSGGLIAFSSLLNFGSGNITLDGGGLQWSGVNTADVSGVLTAIGAGGATFEINSNANPVTFASMLTGAGAITKTGLGTLTLSAANSYNGTTTVTGGTLVLGQIAALGGSGASLMIGSGGTVIASYGVDQSLLNRIASASTGTLALTADTFSWLDFNSPGLTGLSLGAIGNVTYFGTITPANNTFRFGGGGGNLTLTTPLGGANSVVVKNVTVTLPGGSGYTGGTTLQSGTLVATSLADGGTASSVGASSSAAANLVIDGSTLLYIGGAASTDRLFQVGGAGSSATVDASGSGALVFTNPGSLTFGSPNLNRSLTLTGSNINANTLASVLADNGSGVTSLTKNGAGTWLLSGANTYTGVTTLMSGVLSVSTLADGGAASGIGAATSAATNLVFDGGTLRYLGAAQSSDRAFSIGSGGATISAAGSGALNLTAGTIGFIETGSRSLRLIGNNTDANTLAASIANNGIYLTSVTKSGVGTWHLTGVNTYTGVTTIAGGVLGVTSLANGHSSSNIGQADSAASNLRIDGGTLRYTGGTTTTNRLFQVGQTTAGGTATIDASGTGALVFSSTGNMGFGTSGQSRSLVLTGTNTDTNTLRPNLGNNGVGLVSLTKDGTGTWSITGTNSYSGGTTVNAGTLLANNAGGSTFGTGAVTVASGATLGGSGTIGGLATFASGAHLAPGNSPGTLTFTGGLTLNSGAILDFQLGTTSDLIRVSGGTLTGPSSGTITVNLFDSGGFTAGTYTLIDATGATLSSIGATSLDLGTTIAGYDFTFTQNGDLFQLIAVASAVPEPSTSAALAGALALGLAAWRRRKQND